MVSIRLDKKDINIVSKNSLQIKLGQLPQLDKRPTSMILSRGTYNASNLELVYEKQEKQEIVTLSFSRH